MPFAHAIPANTTPPKKNHSLGSALEQRLMPLISRYQEILRETWMSDGEPSSHRDKQRQLWHSENIFQYCMGCDMSLRRKSVKNVRKAIEGGKIAAHCHTS
jgi:hypothetical protein